MRNFLPFSQLRSLKSIELPETPSDNTLQLADCDSLSQRTIDTVFRIPCFWTLVWESRISILFLHLLHPQLELSQLPLAEVSLTSYMLVSIHCYLDLKQLPTSYASMHVIYLQGEILITAYKWASFRTYTCGGLIIMLAERKVKIKWSTDPQNTHWTNGIVYTSVDFKYIYIHARIHARIHVLTTPNFYGAGISNMIERYICQLGSLQPGFSFFGWYRFLTPPQKEKCGSAKFLRLYSSLLYCL